MIATNKKSTLQTALTMFSAYLSESSTPSFPFARQQWIDVSSDWQKHCMKQAQHVLAVLPGTVVLNAAIDRFHFRRVFVCQHKPISIQSVFSIHALESISKNVIKNPVLATRDNSEITRKNGSTTRFHRHYKQVTFLSVRPCNDINMHHLWMHVHYSHHVVSGDRHDQDNFHAALAIHFVPHVFQLFFHLFRTVVDSFLFQAWTSFVLVKNQIKG